MTRLVPVLLLALALEGCVVALPFVTAGAGAADRWWLGRKVEDLERRIEDLLRPPPQASASQMADAACRPRPPDTADCILTWGWP